MIERNLLTPDELKFLPKGTFVVMKTGFHPMKVKLKLFFKWGIEFPTQKYQVTDKGNRVVAYAKKDILEKEIKKKYNITQETHQRNANNSSAEQSIKTNQHYQSGNTTYNNDMPRQARNDMNRQGESKDTDGGNTDGSNADGGNADGCNTDNGGIAIADNNLTAHEVETAMEGLSANDRIRDDIPR